ncbi:EexN family lipoprotein [Sulfuricurvum sp.]|uniref:EexN family lipoprotein n=1 Tax=Sulfuricurvum sp. TaxID=2025608 RepID=UPI0026211E3A|nr:EexN family lipoprotein [Sulfuricurvum sp.]MDD2782294.1 EexN family lipoprotein [Sulfuricurvum sp.]
MKTVFTIAAIMAILLTGCGTPKDEAKTIEYYKTHLDEAKDLIQECKTIGSMTEDERVECASAERAVLASKSKKSIKGNEPHIKTW